jgi:di/tripeptidase
MKEIGIKTAANKPIRGGTDGSQLSAIALPKYFAGGHNFHGK